jgi:hypothetical protein
VEEGMSIRSELLEMAKVVDRGMKRKRGGDKFV